MYYNHKVKKKLKKDIYWSEMNKYWKISFYKPVRENKFLGISFIQNIVFEKKSYNIYKVIGFSIPTVNYLKPSSWIFTIYDIYLSLTTPPYAALKSTFLQFSASNISCQCAEKIKVRKGGSPQYPNTTTNKTLAYFHKSIDPLTRSRWEKHPSTLLSRFFFHILSGNLTSLSIGASQCAFKDFLSILKTITETKYLPIPELILTTTLSLSFHYLNLSKW